MVKRAGQSSMIPDGRPIGCRGRSSKPNGPECEHLNLPFKWRDLVPGAAVCTVAAIIVHAVTTFLLHN